VKYSSLGSRLPRTGLADAKIGFRRQDRLTAVCSDLPLDAPGDQRFERRIGRRLAEAIEPPALQIRDSRRELKPEQGTQGEGMVGIAAAVGVVATGHDLALVVEQPVKDIRGFAGGRRDHLGVERCIAVGKDACKT
jgi:hypothetical protein